MPKTYNEVKASVDSGNKMSFSNSIIRGNGIPLDLSSIHETYDKAVVYAADDPTAYVDQLIAANGEVYVITAESSGTMEIDGTEYNVYLKKVGLDTEVQDLRDTCSELLGDNEDYAEENTKPTMYGTHNSLIDLWKSVNSLKGDSNNTNSNPIQMETVTVAKDSDTIQLEQIDAQDGAIFVYQFGILLPKELYAITGKNTITLNEYTTPTEEIFTVVQFSDTLSSYIPVKGLDYFTEADEDKLVDKLLERIGGYPVFGYLDEDNNIIASSNSINSGEYTVKFKKVDGTITDIGTLRLDDN